MIMKNWITKILKRIKKFSLADWFFGKRREFEVETDKTAYRIGGTSYELDKDGFAVIYDRYVKVGTFINAKTVKEL